MDDGYVGADDYVRMLVLLATSMVIMIVPVIATIGNGSEAYCSCWLWLAGWLARWCRLVGRLVPVGWPVGPCWLAGWSRSWVRLVPFCWTVDLICLAPVDSGWIAGMCCLAGPGWLVCTYVRMLVDRLLPLCCPVGPCLVVGWSRVCGLLVPVVRPVGPGWLPGWPRFVDRSVPCWYVRT